MRKWGIYRKPHLGKFSPIDYIPGQLQVSQRMAKKEKIMMVSRQVLILACSLAITSAVVAADVPVERKINDRQIIDLLADIHNRGAALFNRGDMMGSYRLFEGSLRTIQPLLPGDLQGEVTVGLVQAERQTDPTSKALALHELIE